jgi:hypothetical protein
MDTAACPNPDRTVTLADAGALIAAIPSLLGFHPADSFLVVTIRDNLVGLTVRVDLPPPELHAAVIGRVMRPVRQSHAEQVVVMVVCADRDPAHGDLMRRTVSAMDDAGVPALHALWTPAAIGGAPWHCSLHDHCEGEVPDPAGTECAAAMAMAGLVTFDSRDDLVRLLEPADADHMVRLSRLLDVATQSDHTLSAEHLAVVRAAVESGALPSSDEEFVRLALALSDHRVRDACLDFTFDATLRPTAEKLWLELARCLPPPERAEAASLLAVSAYLRGDGALTNVALEQARRSQPGHILAGLLQGAIDYGVSPAQIHQSLTDAAVDAHIDLIAEPADPTDGSGDVARKSVDTDECARPEDGPADAAGPARPSGERADPADVPGDVVAESAGQVKERDHLAEEPDMST